GSLPDGDIHRSSDAEGTDCAEEGLALGSHVQDCALQGLPASDRVGQQGTVVVKVNNGLCIAFALLVVVAPRVATAHHSFSAVYDINRTVSVQGVVTEFRLVNPHALMLMDVTDESGKVSKWTIEFDGRLNLTEHGWNDHTIVVGERVTVTGNPTHVGAPRIFF